MKQKYITLLVIIGILIALAFIVPTSTGLFSVNNKQKVVKIGVMFPLSGSLSSVGEEITNTLELAENQINKNGGIDGEKIDLIYEDSKCDNQQAINAISKLINIDKTNIVLGAACSGATLSAAPIAEKNQKILLSPFSTSPEITYAGDYIFRTAPSDALQGQKIAEYAIKNNIKTIGIIKEQTDYAEALSKEFKKTFTSLGGKILIEEDYLTKQNDFKTQLIKIKNKNPEGIYILPQTPEKLVLILKQLKELNYNPQILTSEMANNKTVLEENKDLSNGIVFAKVKFDENTGKAKEFLDEYKADYNSTPKTFGTFFFASTYESVYLIKDAIESCNTDQNTECIKEYLYSVKNRDGASGVMTINKYGDAEFDYQIYKIKDGEIKKA